MKKILAALMILFNFEAFANPGDTVIVPIQLLNQGSEVHVVLSNLTDTYIKCTGSVNIQGKSAINFHHYSEEIYSGMTKIRIFSLYDIMDRVITSSHTITCHEI